MVEGFSVKILLIINKIYLQSDLWNGGYFNDQRVVRVVHDKVHPREANYFVKLVPTLVDLSVTGHENPGFFTVFMNCLWDLTG